MSRDITTKAPSSADLLRARLSPLLNGRRGEVRRIVRVSVSIEPVDPLAWLAAQPGGFRFFWRGRDGGSAWAAAGVADLIEGDESLTVLDECRKALPEGARYFGGMRFDASASAGDRWEAFGPVRFVLPRFELRAEDGETMLSMNLVRTGDGAPAVDDLLASLVECSSTIDSPLPMPVGREDVPPTAEWQGLVARALDAIEEERLQKVVLARRTTFRFDEALDAFALLDRVRHVEPGSFHFLVEPEEGSVLVGASPELLFRWDRGSIEAEAVAGTRRRDSLPGRDSALRDELLASDKDGLEHRLVVEHICDSLQGCDSILVGSTDAMRLARKWHLRTPIEAEGSSLGSPVDLLRRLHPTPAVCGTPSEAASRFIADAEQFDRGWYAGPVGWIGRDEAELAVAIRSGLVRPCGEGSTLDVFAGAGIVRGSDPAAEAAEIEHKIGAFTRALGLEG